MNLIGPIWFVSFSDSQSVQIESKLQPAEATTIERKTLKDCDQYKVDKCKQLAILLKKAEEMRATARKKSF